jgi:uncharacterized BrkB/YihY/UPF0761 family membrane protein
MEMNNQEIAEEILRRMEIKKRIQTARKRKVYIRLSVAACLMFIVGIGVFVPLFVSDEHLQETMWTHTASLLNGDPIVGLIALVAICIFTACFALILRRRKMRGRDDRRNF